MGPPDPVPGQGVDGDGRPHRACPGALGGVCIVSVPALTLMNSQGTLSDRGENGGKWTCAKVPDPTHEQVEELMGRYVDGLTRLFDQYKAQAGYPDAVLEIR